MTRVAVLGHAAARRPAVALLTLGAFAFLVASAVVALAARPGGHQASAVDSPGAGADVVGTTSGHLVVAMIASDGPAPPPPTPTPTPIPLPPSSPAGLSIWGGGDSLSVYMNSQLYSLSFEHGMTPVFNCTTGATMDQSCVTSSSLRNRDWFDWPSALSNVVASSAPDVIVFMAGGNDAYSMNGYEPGSEGWRLAYGEMVGAAMDLVRGDGRYVIWVGMPNARYEGYPEFDAKMAAVNSAIAEQAAMREDVAFVDTYALFGGADFDSYAHLRHSDGLHLNVAGGRYLAEEVMRTLIAMMDERRDAAFQD